MKINLVKREFKNCQSRGLRSERSRSVYTQGERTTKTMDLAIFKLPLKCIFLCATLVNSISFSQEYHYSPDNKVDPFKSAIGATPSDVFIATTKLQKYELSQLNLVGTAIGKDSTALILTPSPVEGFLVRVGDSIGNRGGKIISIAKKSITVREAGDSVAGSKNKASLVIMNLSGGTNQLEKSKLDVSKREGFDFNALSSKGPADEVNGLSTNDRQGQKKPGALSADEEFKKTFQETLFKAFEEKIQKDQNKQLNPNLSATGVAPNQLSPSTGTLGVPSPTQPQIAPTDTTKQVAPNQSTSVPSAASPVSPVQTSSPVTPPAIPPLGDVPAPIGGFKP